MARGASFIKHIHQQFSNYANGQQIPKEIELI